MTLDDPTDDRIAVRVSWYAGECHICGSVDLMNAHVLNAVGVYCPRCRVEAGRAASRYIDRQIAEGIRSRMMQIPVPSYDPKRDAV